jgi:hypothetical protein
MTNRKALLGISASITLFLFASMIGTTAMAQSTNISRNSTGGYTQRSVEIPPGSRILYISGQTATDADRHVFEYFSS